MKVMRSITDNQNVIKLYEVYEGENTIYFVMEIIDGISLYEEIKRHSQQPFNENKITLIMKMLIEGIQYYTSKNIMHRDLKPENILFTQKGILKIIDFGLGAFENEFPYIFPKCGTPGFVAPEVANLVDQTKDEPANSVREKTKSLFVMPLRIPYLSKDIEQIDNNLSSFVIKDSLFTGCNSRQKSDASKNAYYTIGSIDEKQQSRSNSRRQNSQQKYKASNIYEKSKLKLKMAINEEEEEDDHQKVRIHKKR
ncbi:protein kinase domain protein [Ichthyophthirius multifiliis]|uniref:Protein kinase domain protein n=1 Tax=Ichthyophthirius multifiliis TaxID=5932 RepID=G0QZ38_ICHMU|nr:protein kinase domain protein [Ichthyophthirius multifiliis]EGR29524.1 protein kinase domain protein [Ichthyophthirius multifiliis]|eukprot:XP_004030760.1 protein kinase domain protein [Ichthyophthirius multifiliis]